MSGIQKLIDTIMSKAKHGGKSDIGAKVYKDEPILMTAAQMKNYTPSRYREMRKLAKGSSIYYEHDERIFYEQAKFMEAFEDDFAYQGEFTRYFPTYQSMNDQELRGYFSWRTKVRRGIIEKTSLSFVFVYLYELLNQIGVNSPREGFFSLDHFWKVYREFDDSIDYYVRRWLKDYIIYYGLDKSLLEGLLDEGYDNALIILLHYKAHTPDEIADALMTFSSYNLENSRFFKQHPQEVKKVVAGVFSSLSVFYGKNHKFNLCEKIFGKKYAEDYWMFQSALFYNRQKHEDTVYEVNEIHKYSCEKGRWRCERQLAKEGKNQLVGALLKNIDYQMRLKYNFKSTLKEVKTTKIFLDAIMKEIEKVQEQEKKQALPKIEIDVSKLQDIRRTALETQSKLIIDDSEAVSQSTAGFGQEATSGRLGQESETAAPNRNELEQETAMTAGNVEGCLQKKTVAAPHTEGIGQQLTMNVKTTEEFGQKGTTSEQTTKGAGRQGTIGEQTTEGAGQQTTEGAGQQGIIGGQITGVPGSQGTTSVYTTKGLEPQGEMNVQNAAGKYRKDGYVGQPAAGSEEESKLDTPANGSTLSDTQFQFLHCLLYGRPYEELIRSNGLMLSVLVDAVNESLFDTFCDTVILYDGDRPELIEDYIDELKGIIEE